MTVALTYDDHGVLYRGGQVRTMDPARPVAEAVATRAGRILAVGSEPSCRAALGFSETTTEGVVDLAGRAVLPGFIDAHIHPLVACFHAFHLDLSAATCLTDVLDALADRARETHPGEWVIGLRLAEDRLTERRLPTMAELDAVGGGRPVVLVLSDCHTSVGSTVALAAAGIRDDREDPPGGRFERDALGQLTGVCYESAAEVLFGSVPVPDLEDLRPVAKGVFADLAAQGITSVGIVLQTDDEGPGGAARALESVGMMSLAEEMPQRLHATLCGNPAKAADLRASSLHEPDRNRMVGGVKLFLDGTLEARTAWLRQPYADQPNARGLLRMDLSTVAHRMEQAHLAELQICVHAVGDAAVARALHLFADLLQRYPVGPEHPVRHRLDHVSFLDDEAVASFADLGLVAVVQPPALAREAGWLAERLGPVRLQQMYPFRTLLSAGVVVAGSSDAPQESTDVLSGIATAMQPHESLPGEPLDATQAVELYTRHAAVALRQEDETGAITEGKRADLVVLSDDPGAVPPEQIASIDVCRTVIDGRIAHGQPDDL